MHKLLRIPPQESEKSAYLTPSIAEVLLHSPLLALGTINSAGRAWTSVWEGKSWFSRAAGQSTMAVSAIVDQRYDPVIETLLEGKTESETTEGVMGRVVSCLGIDLEARKRVKIHGRIVSCILAAADDGTIGKAQVVIRVEQSLGWSDYISPPAGRA
jgi:hypothetical protein